MTKFCVTEIYVDNLEAALDFYCGKLGFERVKTWIEGQLEELDNGGDTLILCQTEKPNRTSYPRDSQVVVAIESEDIEKSIGEFQSKGVEVLFDEPQPFPVGMFTVIRDPAGNYIEVLQFKRD
ncbi:MAG: VOC family protein [Candidatus Thorarchaeota archaeon]|jgi:predicted enzyme related to lactoylglutathione lyase